MEFRGWRLGEAEGRGLEPGGSEVGGWRGAGAGGQGLAVGGGWRRGRGGDGGNLKEGTNLVVAFKKIINHGITNRNSSNNT